MRIHASEERYFMVSCVGKARNGMVQCEAAWACPVEVAADEGMRLASLHLPHKLVHMLENIRSVVAIDQKHNLSLFHPVVCSERDLTLLAAVHIVGWRSIGGV
jgi:hypothetical protein